VLLVPVGDTPVTAKPEGAVSLRDYVNALYSSDPSSEQRRLVARCFQTAAHRAWTSPGGTITSVWLVQFGTPAGARSYTLADEHAFTTDPTKSDAFHVSGVADGMGFGSPKLDADGNTRTAMLGDVGNVAIVVNLYVPARTDNSAAASILQQQSSALTSSSS